MKDFSEMMQQAQKMQAQLVEAQEEIARMEIEGESGAGMVKVTMNGRHEVKRVKLTPELMSEETAILEDLIAAAVNDCVRRLEKALQARMSSLGAGLPGGIDLPFGKMPF